jgi:hypothetical protein
MTVDIWKNLSKALRRMVKSLIAKGNFMRAMAFKRMGITILATVPKDFETEKARQFTEMIKRTKGKNERGDDLGYGSQRKNIMDEGLTLMWTTRK